MKIVLLLLTCTLAVTSGAANGGFRHKGHRFGASKRRLNRKNGKHGSKEKGTKMPSSMQSMNPVQFDAVAPDAAPSVSSAPSPIPSTSGAPSEGPSVSPSAGPSVSNMPSTSAVPSLAPSDSMEPTCIDDFGRRNAGKDGKGSKGGKDSRICDSDSPSQAPSISNAPSISAKPSTSPSTSHAPSLSSEPTYLPSSSSLPSSMPSSCGKGKGCTSKGAPKKSRNNPDSKMESPPSSNENLLLSGAKTAEASASSGNTKLATIALAVMIGAVVPLLAY